ncbi:MAG: cysteine dioxygenase family protein [Gammaproteobacteria bacterium]|nr:cysteine dioxygenase family protein [Gammaproteobacteria bacterium]
MELSTQQSQPALSRFPTGRSSQLESLVKSVRDSLCLPREQIDDIPPSVASVLQASLSASELLNQSQRQPDAGNYRRHTLYRDKDGQFTILALVWLPGQQTPIHGHMAWGAVGIYSGELNISNYEIFGTRAGSMHLKQTGEIDAREGDVASVIGGIDDIHRIKNISSKPAISIHVYGIDIPQESQALNILFPQ